MAKEKYHIGHEIKKEMEAQGMKPIELAEKIHRTKATVYEIFKKSHIATDRLAEIQRVLGCDFFLELSQHAKNETLAALDEDEDALKERFEMLMPEDRFHVLDREKFYQLAEEFVNTEHHKPLVIFHNHWQLNQPDVIKIIADKDLRPGQMHSIYLSDLRKKGKSDDEIIQDAKSMPQPILDVSCLNNDEDFLFLTKLADKTSKKVYAYCREENALDNDYHGSIAYRDRAIQSFGSWCEQIHFVFVDDEWQSYRRNRWLFLAYMMNDVLSFIKSVCPTLPCQESPEDRMTILEWLNDPKRLMEDYRNYLDIMAQNKHQLKDFRLMYFDNDEVSIKRESDTRWVLSLPACENYQRLLQGDWVKEQLEKYHARTTMWIIADEDGIYDYDGSVIQQVTREQTD